jgi:hypothetical protein
MLLAIVVLMSLAGAVAEFGSARSGCERDPPQLDHRRRRTHIDRAPADKEAARRSLVLPFRGHGGRALRFEDSMDF